MPSTDLNKLNGLASDLAKRCADLDARVTHLERTNFPWQNQATEFHVVDKGADDALAGQDGGDIEALAKMYGVAKRVASLS